MSRKPQLILSSLDVDRLEALLEAMLFLLVPDRLHRFIAAL